MSGKCYLVGAGPGDIGLVTLRARQLVEKADVLIYDYLVNPEILSWTKRTCELIYAGKKADQHTLTQDQINHLIIEKAQTGAIVVRLKGGDPFVFGRGGEEAEELLAAGCEFEIVPGITSAIAAAAYAGIPVTHRSHTSTLTFLTGHEDPTKPDSSINWEALAKLGGTFAIYMGMERIEKIMASLMHHGLSSDTPVGVIQWGTTSRQKSVVATAQTIPQAVAQAGIAAPAIIIVGDVAQLKDKLTWFEKKTLHGKRIVLTRTREQASRMKEAFAEKGADVWELPTIQIIPLEWSRTHRISKADYDWLIFTSPNAVDAFFNEYLKQGDIRDFSGLRIAAVGPATQSKLEQRGLKPDLIPKNYTAEGLVESWSESTPTKALFPCGNLADTVIEKGLSAKKCQVTRLEVYRTEPVTEDRTGSRKKLETEGADWLIFASSSAVENFHALHLSWKRDSCRFASLGPVTSAAMRKLGYAVDYEAPESRIETLVQGLVDLLSTETHPS